MKLFDKTLWEMYHKSMKTKLVFLFMLLVGLCNAPEVILRWVSGELAGNPLALDTNREIVPQVWAAASKIVNEAHPYVPVSEAHPDVPNDSFIRKYFEILNQDREPVRNDQDIVMNEENQAEMTLVVENREIMILPLVNKPNYVTLVFKSRGDRFVANDLHHNIRTYNSIIETSKRTLDHIYVHLMDGIYFIKRLAKTDLDKVVLIQKLDANNYVEVELFFQPIPDDDEIDAGHTLFKLSRFLGDQAILPDISYIQQQHLDLEIPYNYTKPLSEQEQLEQEWKLSASAKRYNYSPFYHENIPA